MVWQADGEPLPGVGYGQRLAERLRRLGCRVAVVDYRRRAITAGERAAPVHVLAGGETSAFATDAATRRARAELTALAQRSWADEVTLIGICLGAQLLARVVAPELPRSTPTAGMEAGWRPVEGPEGIVHVAELHYEQIHPALASVDGVTVTHQNDHSPIQAFRWGPSTVGMQFHAEWSPRDLRTVLPRHRDVLDAHHADPDAALRTLPRDRALHRSRSRGRHDPFHDLVVAPIRSRLEQRRRQSSTEGHLVA